MKRELTLRCFCSAKGGVGKSTLAVASATLAQRRGQCVLVDADLTGTSLADGLSLCAPRVALSDGGTMDLVAPATGEYLTLEETRKYRTLRRQSKRREHSDDPVPPPPYLNDALAFRGADNTKDCSMAAMLWRAETGGEVGYLPSSSLDNDIDLALGWLYQEPHQDWVRRLAWLLFMTAEQIPELSDIVIDLPPGLFAFSHATLALLAEIANRTELPDGYPDFEQVAVWNVRPYLVTSQDRNDLVVAMESYARLVTRLSRLRPLVNRLTESIESVKESITRHFGGIRVGDRLVPVGSHPKTMGRVFLDGSLSMAAGEENELLLALDMEP